MGALDRYAKRIKNTSWISTTRFRISLEHLEISQVYDRLCIWFLMERAKRNHDFPLLRFILCYSRIYISFFSFVSPLLEEYGVMFKMIKCPEFYLEPMEDLFGVSSEGELKLLPDNIYLPQDTYCLDVISTRQDNYEEKLYAFICFPDTTLQDNIRWETFRFTLSRFIVIVLYSKLYIDSIHLIY